MSLRCLKAAVLAQLRLAVLSGGMGYEAKNCDLGPPDGQPAPMAGKFWVSIHDGGEGSEQEGCLEETFGIRLTVSERIDVPLDRVGQKTIDEALLGLNDRCMAIRAMMVNYQYTIMNAANTLINAQTGGPFDGFNEPLFYEGPAGPAELVSGDWFHAEPEELAAVRKTLRFGRAKRIQKIGNVN